MRHPQQKKHVEPNVFVTSSGSRKKRILSPVHDGKKVVLRQTGEFDIQDQINAYAPLTDINFILSRLGQGDSSVLNPSMPFYGSMLDMPTDYREVLNVALQAETAFTALPLDVRRSFNNDYRAWLASSGTRDWLAKMKNYIGGYDEKTFEPDSGSDSSVSDNHSGEG